MAEPPGRKLTRTTLTIPVDLVDRVGRTLPRLNWSRVFRERLEQLCDEEDRNRKEILVVVSDSALALQVVMTALVGQMRADPLVPPADCRHCLKIAVNENRWVCPLCRTTVDEPIRFGIVVVNAPGTI